MAGNDDMTHYMKHLYLAFTERVFANSVSTESAAVYTRAMWHSNTHSRRHQGVGLEDTPRLTLCFLFKRYLLDKSF